MSVFIWAIWAWVFPYYLYIGPTFLAHTEKYLGLIIQATHGLIMGIPILGFFWAGYYGHNMEIAWAITRGQLVDLPHGLGLRMIRAISNYHHLGWIIWV